MRIVELLGPGEHGGDRRSENFNSPARESNEVPEKDRYKFRLMAEHRDYVEGVSLAGETLPTKDDGYQFRLMAAHQDVVEE